MGRPKIYFKSSALNVVFKWLNDLANKKKTSLQLQGIMNISIQIPLPCIHVYDIHR